MEINLKISLIKMEELLKPYHRFVRCHNQYIVNADKIEKCIGPKKKMKVQLIGCKTILSVSYKHANEIIQLIKKRSKKD
jgi:DNA-binding LytR/AlgR family response regulator